MEHDILIQEYEKKLSELQTRFDEYKKETEKSFSALKEENKAEIEKINARYREELRSVLSAHSTPETPKSDNESDTGDDENTHDSRIKHAIKKLKSKYKIGD